MGALETETLKVEAKTLKMETLEAEILVAARTHERVEKPKLFTPCDNEIELKCSEKGRAHGTLPTSLRRGLQLPHTVRLVVVTLLSI